VKKILLSFLFITFVASAFSQSFKYGITAGLNQSKYPETFTAQGQEVSVRGEKITSSATTGFHFGFFTDITIRKISIQSGLLYTTKGGINDYSYSIIDYSYDDRQKLKLNYLESPINILYHLPLKFGDFFIGGGPYIAIGISGNLTEITTSTSGNNSKEGNVNFGSDPTNVKNPDYGLNGAFGLNLNNKWRFSVNYEYGLANPSTNISVKSRNEALGFSLGFYFP
jgi:hypothetical protein